MPIFPSQAVPIGGTAQGSAYPVSYGIAKAYDGNIAFGSSGTLNAKGGEAMYSYGISSSKRLYVSDSCTVNASGADPCRSHTHR